MEKEKVRRIVGKHRHEKAAILAILHEVQEKDRQLDMETLKYIAELLKVPFAYVYGITTFYDAFSTTKKGDTQIRVCNGISCHIRGADQIKDILTSRLNLDLGQTSWNEKYSLDKVECLGLCSIGPNVSFNGRTYSHLDKDKLLDIFQEQTGEDK